MARNPEVQNQPESPQKIEKGQKKLVKRLATALGVGLTLAGCTVSTEIIITSEIKIPFIEWLWFDQVSKSYFAEYGNPYGLRSNERAGVLVEQAVVINGRLENGFGLRPEVLRAVINENFNEGIYTLPLPFNLEHDRGIVMRELTNIDPAISPNSRYNLLGVKIPTSTIIYAPIDSPYLQESQQAYRNYPYIWFNGRGFNGENFDFFFQQWQPFMTLHSGRAQIGEPLGFVSPNVFVKPFKDHTLFTNAGNYEMGFAISTDWSKLGGAENLLRIGNWTVFTLPK